MAVTNHLKAARGTRTLDPRAAGGGWKEGVKAPNCPQLHKPQDHNRRSLFIFQEG